MGTTNGPGPANVPHASKGEGCTRTPQDPVYRGRKLATTIIVTGDTQAHGAGSPETRVYTCGTACSGHRLSLVMFVTARKLGTTQVVSDGGATEHAAATTHHQALNAHGPERKAGTVPGLAGLLVFESWADSTYACISVCVLCAAVTLGGGFTVRSLVCFLPGSWEEPLEFPR